MTLIVVTNAKSIVGAVSSLEHQLRDGSETVQRTLTFPGTHGPIARAEIVWRKDDGFWAFFRELETRFWCAFGTAIGEPNEPLNISIEINPPLEGVNRSVYGQIVTDEAAELYLAHKGGLGGGGTVTIENFWRLFRNGERQVVKWKEDGREARMHLIGKIGSADLSKRLSHFIHEAERIRRLARTGQLLKPVQ